MMLARKIWPLLALALVAPQAAQAAELIREFKGSRSMQTAEFEVDAPWILDWRVSGDYSREMAVDVSLVESLTNIHQGNVLKTKTTGNGVRMFNQGGRFYFRVDSTLADWTRRVEEQTAEEAKLYTPRNNSQLDY